MFHVVRNIWQAEDVPLETLAQHYGTPLYVYSVAQICQNYETLHAALTATGLRTHIHFAVKANYNLAVLRQIKSLGMGADVVSGGEMQRALVAGMTSDDIVFSGVGKTDEELRAALVAGIHQINLESAEELQRLMALAHAINVKIDCAVRINPDIDANTHAKINTGKSEHKFGVDMQTAAQMFDMARGHAHVNLRGLAMHIGSQLLDVSPFDDAFAVMAQFALEMRAKQHTLDRLDIGGGVGVPYEPQDPAADLQKFSALIKKHFAGFSGDIYTEPGRFLVANAGVLLSRVIFIKRTAHKTFVVIDAAMNDLMRPAMYDAYHPIFSAHVGAGQTMRADIVGGICETSDLFAARRELPANLQSGDLLVIGIAGAYGATMASTYNARDQVAEVMVNGLQHVQVRQRWGIAEQLKLENIPEWVK